MLNNNTPYDISRIAEASGNVDIFIYTIGEYSEYQVFFEIVENKTTFFKNFDPEGKTPIAFFHIQGNIKIPIPIEKVVRLFVDE